MEELFRKFYKTIEENGLILPKENILAGISGGIDSVVLLDLLVKLKEVFDYN
ncbi:tRNA lysidine(34) synthetase TilS, partial [Vibrio parahaemolyticus]|nr:tRNA lysidine(34) synthetase TilS [Vibrio parahaemolyticus]